MSHGSWTWEETASATKGGDGIGLEIIRQARHGAGGRAGGAAEGAGAEGPARELPLTLAFSPDQLLRWCERLISQTNTPDTPRKSPGAVSSPIGRAVTF
jgi:hypothetical protein